MVQKKNMKTTLSVGHNAKDNANHKPYAIIMTGHYGVSSGPSVEIMKKVFNWLWWLERVESGQRVVN